MINLIFISSLQITFLIVGGVILLLLAAFITYLLVKRKHIKQNFKYEYYKIIKSIALYYDSYLVNNFCYSEEKKPRIELDHILFGEKYIYLIVDYYIDGCLLGKEKDASFILVDSEGRKRYIDNPLIDMEKRLDIFSLLSGLDSSLLKGICVTSNNCETKVDLSGEQFAIIKISSLKKFIDKSEKDESVSNINQTQLEKAVQILAKYKPKIKGK